MESKLYVAAMTGNVTSLRGLLAEEERLLDSIMTGTRTPLHIAAMFGHLDFVLEVLDRKAELASKQDSQGSTPLHLAAAKGYLNIVACLLRVNPDICFVHDKYHRNPLHIAATKGHVDVLEFLVGERPDAARDLVEDNQTILHLCVKHDRLEALKLLIDILGDNKFINWKDDHNNTILHWAAEYGQTETLLFLTKKGCDKTIKNSRRFTALDLLSEEERERKRQDSMHNMLMVVGILVAAIAFEAGRETDDFVEHSIMYRGFIACNTISFIASLSVIMLLISDVPLGRRIPTWVPMLTMWVAINFTAATYAIVIQVSCPKGGEWSAGAAGTIAVLVWLGLMGLISLYHVVHLIRESLKKRMKLDDLRPKWQRIVTMVFVPEAH